MADTNKIKYGIKNATIFPATIAADGSATYGTAIPVPGSVSLSLDQQGETTPFYADNIVYYTSVANNGYEGDWELAKLPDAVLTEILGYQEDTNKVLIEDANAPVVHFALAFEFEGDAHARRHILYNCTMNRPSVAGSTKEESIEPQTETVTITATTIYNAALDTDIVKASATQADSATQYAAWFTTAYQPA
jgi:phi13 family phage major tail protein